MQIPAALHLYALNATPVCDYEGSIYQQTFWDAGGRAYEDGAEAVALKRLLPSGGRRLLEIGAGAGRNTPRYTGFNQIVLLDYSRTQLQQAQERLGQSGRSNYLSSLTPPSPAETPPGSEETHTEYIYVAADVYATPFVDGLFDAATMIRVIHHMVRAPAALQEVRRVLTPGAVFILEYANKQNLKAIARWLLRRQTWNPFSPEPVEFARLNFDFHPQTMRGWLREAGFDVRRQLAVSYLRLGLLKRLFPTGLLVWLDSWAQLSGEWWQYSPSVFVRALASASGAEGPAGPGTRPGPFFRCPACGCVDLKNGGDHLLCPECGRRWAVRDGIYDFKEPVG